ncbi:MAG: PEP-CTERM sorting domain-containing protein [Limisphaerales bacterium]
MKKSYYLMTGLIAASVVLSCTNALASSAAGIEAGSSGSSVTYDNASGAYPTITTIESAPVGSLDGYNYTTWAFLANDGTGSIDLYGAVPGGYTPTVGDNITAAGTYSPYHQIPEIGSISSISAISSGNPVPSPVAYTIPQLTASGTGAVPLSIAGYTVALDNVSLYTDSAATIPVSGNFATHANTTLYAKDGSGNIMEIYVWASSYSVDGAMGGTPIPTGTVDITGFVSQSGSFAPELTPMSITEAVPEPSTVALFGIGSTVCLGFLRRFKK